MTFPDFSSIHIPLDIVTGQLLNDGLVHLYHWLQYQRHMINLAKEIEEMKITSLR